MRSNSLYAATMFIVIIVIISCAGTNSRIEIKRSEIKYSKPQTANNLVLGEKVEYRLWFYSYKWSIILPQDESIKNMTENLRKGGFPNHVLRHKTNFALVYIIENPKPLTFEEFYESYKRIPNTKITDKDIRTVNNCEVMYIKEKNVSDTDNLIILNYFYSNQTGSVLVTVAIKEKLFAELESDILNLFNGLVDPTK